MQKYDIYCLINKMVEDGKSVIMISSEMPELLGMCDRIYVMSEGRLAVIYSGRGNSGTYYGFDYARNRIKNKE